ncbi:hypothetical protein JKP88DRAFT_265965 [Tribonema minus]|uniref:Uncharacterized protein n=1 Tax=Tribonema minus TaxID=303371 RepID=A0A836C7X7_9STRA|nr:hypothetical protein JKP88DRAFT_265965 [Tribonema minus]
MLYHKSARYLGGFDAAVPVEADLVECTRPVSPPRAAAAAGRKGLRRAYKPMSTFDGIAASTRNSMVLRDSDGGDPMWKRATPILEELLVLVAPAAILGLLIRPSLSKTVLRWLLAGKLVTAAAAATYFTYNSPPQSRQRRVKRVMKALLSSTAPPVEDSAKGVYLIDRELVCAAITPPGFRNEPGPEVTLMSGARAAGKSTVSRLAFPLLQLKHVREQSQHKHAQQLLGAHQAAAVADDLQDLMPVFVTDLTSSINSDQLYQLLLLFKRLGPDASLARFVVMVSAAHTAAGLSTPLGQLRVQVIEVGDLEEAEGKVYVSKALHSWLALRPNVMLTPDEENDIVSDTVARCGTLVGRLKRVCRTGWGRCSSAAELKLTVDQYVAEEQLQADSGLESFLSSLSAAGASKKQLCQFLRLFVLPEAELSACASSLAAATSASAKEGMIVAQAVRPPPRLGTAAEVLGVARKSIISGNLSTEGFAHPLLINLATGEMRAASVSVETSMRQQISKLQKSINKLQDRINDVEEGVDAL